MIPKTIHYCWFGHNPKPKLAQKCIKSWEKHCADYKIIEWNEENFDISSAPQYVKEAYAAQKWAFVTDYVRLWVLVVFGGIYMDTDVQVLKSLDPFLANRAFSGFEDEKNIPTGIMGSEKGLPLFRELLSFYDTARFYLPDGSINYQTNVTTITNTCIKYGLIQNNSLQTIEGFTLYPKEVFCPIDYHTEKLRKTRNTVTIHWFAASWHNKEQEKWRKSKKKKLRKQLRKERWDYIVHSPNRALRRVLGNERYEALKKRLKR